MKMKKYLSLFFILSMLILLLGSCSLEGEKGETGEQGPQGIQGEPGKDGINGTDGLTPYIGENGNWWIGETDTGIKAEGTDGKDGVDGTDGLTPFIGENGNWWIGETDTGVKAEGTDGKDGINGTDGLTPYIGENGNWWIGEKDTGVKAEGADGKDGVNGTDGLTPYIGENGNWWIGDTDTNVKAENSSNGTVENGKSAYEIYLKYHPEYNKTEEEWIKDLINGSLVSNTHNVVFKSEDIVLFTQEILHGYKAKKPEEPTREGYVFKGWFYEDLKWEFLGYSVTENMVLNAKWERIASEGLLIANNILTGIGTCTDNDIIVPDTVIGVADGAFWGNYNISSVTMYDNVKFIGDHAFAECISMHTIVLPNTLKVIEANAFENCRNLRYMEIPNSVESIDSYAFNGCDELEITSIPESLIYLGDDAFNHCRLTNIFIPKKLEFIGTAAFNCFNITSIEVDEYNPYFDSRENCNAIICKSNDTLLLGCNATIIPNSVKKIGIYAFFGCEALTNINVPEGVEEINFGAFQYCSNLKSVTLPKTITKIEADVFYECPILESIYINVNKEEINNICFYQPIDENINIYVKDVNNEFVLYDDYIYPTYYLNGPFTNWEFKEENKFQKVNGQLVLIKYLNEHDVFSIGTLAGIYEFYHIEFDSNYIVCDGWTLYRTLISANYKIVINELNCEITLVNENEEPSPDTKEDYILINNTEKQFNGNLESYEILYDSNINMNVKYKDLQGATYKYITTQVSDLVIGKNVLSLYVTNNGSESVNFRIDVNGSYEVNNLFSANIKATQDNVLVNTDPNSGGSMFTIEANSTSVCVVEFDGTRDIRDIVFFIDSHISNDTSYHTGDLTISEIEFSLKELYLYINSSTDKEIVKFNQSHNIYANPYITVGDEILIGSEEINYFITDFRINEEGLFEIIDEKLVSLKNGYFSFTYIDGYCDIKLSYELISINDALQLINYKRVIVEGTVTFYDETNTIISDDNNNNLKVIGAPHLHINDKVVFKGTIICTEEGNVLNNPLIEKLDREPENVEYQLSKLDGDYVFNNGDKIVFAYGNNVMGAQIVNDTRNYRDYIHTTNLVDSHQQIVTLVQVGDYWRLKVEEEQFLYYDGSGSNYLFTGNVIDDSSLWKISYVDGFFEIQNVTYNDRYIQWNISNAPRFSTYKHTMGNIELYLVSTKDINI